MSLILLFSLVWALLSFYLYWPFFLRALTGNNAKTIFLYRYYGAFLFGGVPMLFAIFSGSDLHDLLGSFLPKGQTIWHLVSILIIFSVVPISYLQSRSKSNLEDYPQVRIKEWTRGLVIGNALSWAVYLVGYEILFRGIMWFPLVGEFEFETALVINVMVYSLTHSSKSFKEGLGTIPVGVLLAIIAWKTNSIFYPVLIHWAMALSNSFFSVKHHPEMKYNLKK